MFDGELAVASRTLFGSWTDPRLQLPLAPPSGVDSGKIALPLADLQAARLHSFHREIRPSAALPGPPQHVAQR